jgi:hypothetical protein
MKIRVTHKELLLATGILVALVLFLLYWTNQSMPSFTAPASSDNGFFYYDLPMLVRKTFSLVEF